MKLEREALMTWLDSAWNAAVSSVSTATWALIGDDIEDMAVELNPDVEQFRNILGKTRVRDNGYEPSVSADPFYADSSSALYTKIKDIAMQRLKGDACKTLMLEIIISDTDDTTHEAFVTEVTVKPESYGGDTAGFNIPFAVSESGERVKGTVTAASVTAGAPVFTADGASGNG